MARGTRTSDQTSDATSPDSFNSALAAANDAEAANSSAAEKVAGQPDARSRGRSGSESTQTGTKRDSTQTHNRSHQVQSSNWQQQPAANAQVASATQFPSAIVPTVDRSETPQSFSGLMADADLHGVSEAQTEAGISTDRKADHAEAGSTSVQNAGGEASSSNQPGLAAAQAGKPGTTVTAASTQNTNSGTVAANNATGQTAAANATGQFNEDAIRAEFTAALGGSLEEIGADRAGDSQPASAPVQGPDEPGQKRSGAQAAGISAAGSLSLSGANAADQGNAATPAVKGASGTDEKGAPANGTDAKQHTDSQPVHSDKTGDQGSTPSGNQDQAAQSGPAVSAPAAASNHVATPDMSAHLQTVRTAMADSHAATAGADSTGKLQESRADTPDPDPAAVNSARLIQRVNDSEIRVAMRSSDFGNISVSTLASRDAISAQIAVDHGDLAKTIAAHLPEMQARLGGNQPFEVRISSSQQFAGGLGNESGGAQQDTGNGRNNGRQAGQTHGGAYAANQREGAAMPVAAAAISSSSQGHARLDIRV